MQLPDQGFSQACHLFFIGLETLVKLHERLQRLSDSDLTRRVPNLNIESDRHKVKRVLLVKIAELLHYHQ